MTISWTKVIPHDQAARRAGGRRRINAERHREAERRRDLVVRMVDAYGLEHGVRQRIANELGVSRSTISRDIKSAIYLPGDTPPPTTHVATTEWIRTLEPLGARLAIEGCDCEDKTEPSHSLGHAFQFTAETLDAVEDGEADLPVSGQELFEEVRDLLIGLLYTGQSTSSPTTSKKPVAREARRVSDQGPRQSRAQRSSP